jgi:hypothetical protein
LLGVSACGSSFIILRVDAELSVPAQANSLQVVTLDVADLTRELANVDLPLVAGDEFPLDVLLEPADDTPPHLHQRVTAFLDGVPVARREVEHDWQKNRINTAAFALDLVPP